VSQRGARLTGVTPEELRVRARQELDELGPEPSNPREHELWAEERRGAVVLLASLAEWNAGLCREAALVSAEWEPSVAHLLLDAAEERG
jgi:hypothetical protein